ncbi:MAG: DUF374 domain-containing protein [Bdellovibrionota bacterium]
MLTLIAYLYLWFVGVTSRVRIVSEHQDSIRTFRERRSVVYTFWFKHISFLLYYFGAHRMRMLMTPQGKTDILTRTAQWLGLKVAKGSVEAGGRHALLTLIEQLKAGDAVALAADGSRGPAGKAKAGCFILAQETACPILPVAWKARWNFSIPLRSGILLVPLPFNTIELRLGESLKVDRHYQFNELDSIKNQLTNILDRLSS